MCCTKYAGTQLLLPLCARGTRAEPEGGDSPKVASIRLATTVCDAARQHTREGWDAKKAEQAPSTLPLPQRRNPVTVLHGKVIG